MKKIDYKNIPIKLPFTHTIVCYLLLDKFNVNDFIWGIFITVFMIYWISSIIIINNQEKIDIFKDQSKYNGKSIFQQRLEKMKQKQES